MKKPLAELYAQHPFNDDERWWPATLPLDDAIAAGSELHTLKDPLTYLDAMHQTDRSLHSALNFALLSLPPAAVADNFGEDIALWTSVASVVAGHNDEMNAYLLSAYGHSSEDLAIARGWQWRRGGYESSAKVTLAQYGLMRAMRSELCSDLDVPALIQSAAKPGVTLSPTRIDDYSLIPIEADPYNPCYDGGRVKGWHDDEVKQIAYQSWIDAPTGFALTYKGVPNAMAGVAMRGIDELMLYQIQGVQAKKIDPSKSRCSSDYIVGAVSSRGIAPLDWQKLIVSTTESMASSLGLTQTGIQAAANNVWAKPHLWNDTKPHLTVEQATKAYDEPAKRLGYAKRSDDKKNNWHKTIS